jgi:hypothetical protein
VIQQRTIRHKKLRKTNNLSCEAKEKADETESGFPTGLYLVGLAAARDTWSCMQNVKTLEGWHSRGTEWLVEPMRS